MKQRIRIDEKRIADLWRLKCVTMAEKAPGGLCLCCQDRGRSFLACEGDWLCQDDDGTWRTEKGGAG